MDLPYLNALFTPNHEENLSNLIAPIWCVFNLKVIVYLDFQGSSFGIACMPRFPLRVSAFLK
jgi:hypothetical protein